MAASTNPSRRELLGALGACGVLGMSSQSSAIAGHAGGRIGPATDADVAEHARLRDLDLDDPKVVAKRKRMPTLVTYQQIKAGGTVLRSGFLPISVRLHLNKMGNIPEIDKTGIGRASGNTDRTRDIVGQLRLSKS